MTRIYFKENLARLRKNNKLSQDQLGKIVGKSHNAIYKWENGKVYLKVYLKPQNIEKTP